MVRNSCLLALILGTRINFKKLDMAIVIPLVAVGFFLPTGFLIMFAGNCSYG